MTRRQLRHAVPFVKLAFALAVLLAIAWLAGVTLNTAWAWGSQDGRMLPAAIAFACGIALVLLCLLFAVEINVLWQRWMREQAAEDRTRCQIPTCDRPLVRPYVVEQGLGAICIACMRRIARAEAVASDLPRIAWKAGI